jgi:hypothetical protein
MLGPRPLVAQSGLAETGWREVPGQSREFAMKNFLLDSRYTNLPEERIHRKYVLDRRFWRTADINRHVASAKSVESDREQTSAVEDVMTRVDRR